MLFVEDLDSLPALHIAAYKGDTPVLKTLVVAGGPIDMRANLAQDYGKMLHDLTPLMVAAGSTHSNIETVSLLLDLGADRHAKSAGGLTVLWYAASSGDVSRVQLLLELGGNPNESVDIGPRLVGEAAEAGDLPSVQLLLSAGASPHPFANVDSYANTSCYIIPLFRAAASGNAACVSALLAAGVSAQVYDSSGQTALSRAKSAEVVAVLLQAGCPLNVADKFGMTALDAALDDEQADVARALVAAGMSLGSRDKYGSTPLLKLCFSMEVSAVMVQLLIDLGADIGARTYHGRTALHQAAELWVGDRRDLLGDVIRILVKAGIPVDIKDNDGCTPLHLPVGTEGTDIGAVEALLDLGADINAINNEGLSPLMITVDDGYYAVEVVPLLLSRGAAIRQTTPDGLTVRHYAVDHLQVWERIVASGTENTVIDDPSSKERHLSALEKAKSVLQIIDVALADSTEE